MENKLTTKEVELIVDALLFYNSCQSEFVSYDENIEFGREINKIINKILKELSDERISV